MGLIRGGAGTALVGSHAQVAERIVEYHALGIDEFFDRLRLLDTAPRA